MDIFKLQDLDPYKRRIFYLSVISEMVGIVNDGYFITLPNKFYKQKTNLI